MEPQYDTDEMTAEVTFKNKSGLTPSAFKAQIEAALESLSDDLAGEIFIASSHDSTGVVIGNG